MTKNIPMVSIIIANWNGGNIFGECLKSLQKINYSNCELIIVDNGSTDGSQNLYKKFKFNFKKVMLLQNDKNLGFAIANNQGLEVSKGEFILLLNNDTKVEPKLIEKLVDKIIADPKIGVIQPKIYIMNNEPYLDNTGSFLTKIGFLEHVGYMKKDSEEYNMEKEIFSTKGACMLIRKDITEEIGLFDNKFGSYFEESDFCWRVWLLGYKVIFYPKARISHKVGFSSKKLNQIVLQFNSFKNRIRSILKNLEIYNLITIMGMHIFLLFSLSIFYILKLQFAKSRMIFDSVLWNIYNLSDTLKERSIIQKKRKISDKEIFRKVLHKTKFIKMLVKFLKG